MYVEREREREVLVVLGVLVLLLKRSSATFCKRTADPTQTELRPPTLPRSSDPRSTTYFILYILYYITILYTIYVLL